MKNAILLTLAAAVATVPAILGVAGNTTFSQSIPASIPAGASVVPSVDDRGHESEATTSPTASATSDDRGRGSDDATSALPTGDDRGSDDGATASATRSAATARATVDDDGATTSATRSAATARATVDDTGAGTEPGDDSGGHGASSGGSGSSTG